MKFPIEVLELIFARMDYTTLSAFAVTCLLAQKAVRAFVVRLSSIPLVGQFFNGENSHEKSRICSWLGKSM